MPPGVLLESVGVLSAHSNPLDGLDGTNRMALPPVVSTLK